MRSILWLDATTRSIASSRSFCRRTRNNPVLIGDPGVGKTAIVEGLAQRIVDGDVPSFLADKRILVLDLSLIVAGTKYRGQFEERLKTIMKELVDNPNTVVFIDELHTLVGAGSAEGSLDAANILKPALSRGEIQCIGATTPAEYRKSIEKDRSLERRFQAVKVGAPSENESVRILQGVKSRYEKFHMVNYTDEAIESSVYLSNRYIPDRFLPDKAIDLLDESGARVKLRQATLPSEMTDIQRRIKFIVARMESAISGKDFEKAEHYPRPGATGAREPSKRSREIQYQRNHQYGCRDEGGYRRRRFALDRRSSQLHQRRGDAAAVSYRRRAAPPHRQSGNGDQRVGASHSQVPSRIEIPNRPAGSFLFLGPTGVGKTEMARSLAQFLFGSEKSLIRFDMSEFMEKHSVSKLIGSPPGYVGYEEGGQLTERVKRNPYSVILLDEIEKAHPDVFNILLQVFEDGHLTDGLGNTIDFKNTIIIMTSNIGARFIEKKGRMGFASNDVRDTAERVNEMVMGEVKRTFNPEFINRVDEIIIFDALTDFDLQRITRLLVDQLNLNLKEKGIIISIRDEGVDWLLQKTLSDRSYGARPLRRAIQRHIEDALSEAFIRGNIRPQRPIEVGVEDGKLFYWQDGRGGALSA